MTLTRSYDIYIQSPIGACGFVRETGRRMRRNLNGSEYPHVHLHEECQLPKGHGGPHDFNIPKDGNA